jgi:hypothetical protein
LERQRLLRRLDEAWEDLKASYAGLSTEELLEPGVAGDWSVKDLIAHVAWWEEEALTHLPVILAGRRPPRYSTTYGGIDAFNAKRMDQRRSLSISEVLRQRDETHRRLTDLIARAPAEQLAGETRFLRRLRLDTYAHYREHAGAIREWRKRRAARMPNASGRQPE